MSRSIVLLDGGMGQELIHRSSQPPSPLSFPLLRKPHRAMTGTTSAALPTSS